jgi:hypothetical protein
LVPPVVTNPSGIQEQFWSSTYNSGIALGAPSMAKVNSDPVVQQEQLKRSGQTDPLLKRKM